MNLKFQMNSSLDQLDSLCRAVEGLQSSLMCTDRQMCEVILVLEELVANVINHGGGSYVEVELKKEWEELIIIITDDGGPFDPTTAPAVDIHQPLEKRSVGGLGIHLVDHYTDSSTYRREGEKNILTLRKVI